MVIFHFDLPFAYQEGVSISTTYSLLQHKESIHFALIKPTIGGILLLGPLSNLALLGLKKQEKALEKKEEGEHGSFRSQPETTMTQCMTIHKCFGDSHV